MDMIINKTIIESIATLSSIMDPITNSNSSVKPITNTSIMNSITNTSILDLVKDNKAMITNISIVDLIMDSITNTSNNDTSMNTSLDTTTQEQIPANLRPFLPKKDLLSSLPHTLIYITLGVLVSFANGLTFITIVKSPRLNSMADFYLASLAVADFLVGIAFIITALTKISTFQEAFKNRYVCLSYLGVIVTSLTASLLTLVCLSFDRCICIWNPLNYRKRNNKQIGGVLITLIWILSIGYAGIPLFTDSGFVIGAPCIATIQHPKWYIVYSHSAIGVCSFVTVAICYFIIGWKHRKQVNKFGRRPIKQVSKYINKGFDDNTSSENSQKISRNEQSKDERDECQRTKRLTNEREPEKHGDGDLTGGQCCIKTEGGVGDSDGKRRLNRKLCTREDVCLSNSNERIVSNSSLAESFVSTEGNTLSNVSDSQSHDTNLHYGGGNVKSKLGLPLNQVMSKQNMRMLRMIFIILIIFFISWFPGIVIVIVSEFVVVDASIQLLFLVLTFLNSLLNVVVYITMNRRYREEILSVLGCCCPCRKTVKGLGGGSG